jgi:phosphate transport system permease protein
MKTSGDAIAKAFFLSCAGISAVMTSAVFLFMIVLGLPLFRKGSFMDIWMGTWEPAEGVFGIGHMIAGTFWIAIPAVVLSLPLSLGTSFVIAGLGGPRLRETLISLVRFMTGIPTVIYGFLGIFLLVPLIREELGGPGMCVLAASMVLAVLITPTMVLFFSHSLMAVDPAHVQAARALGAGRIQRLLYVMLPEALGGMATGLILALGRALGDTLIALMLAGNALGMPAGFLDPARTLTGHIALVQAADYDSLEFRSIFACGIALYLFTTASVIAVRFIERGKREAA